MTNSNQHLLDKLSFWHKLEFFIPFNLDDRAREQENQKKFWRALGDTSPLVFGDSPNGMEVASYQLFLGSFDKSEIRNIIPSDERTGGDQFEDDERADLEGLTCMASLKLTADAIPAFDEFEISTLPWAIGQCRTHGLRALSNEAFTAARVQLEKRLHNFKNARPAPEEEPNTIAPLQPSEVDKLVELLSAWSGFSPSNEDFANLLVVYLKKKRPAKADEPQEDEKPDDDEPSEIGILNSFYIDDIERAMHLVQIGQTPKALRQYLTPLEEEERHDLYSDLGRSKIIEALRPRAMNSARWSSDPDHAMSLMQQFAINNSFEDFPNSGMFSVNGPPGTGKTTLLRDIIAENITKRAAVLSDLRMPADAFQNRPGKVRHLIPELTGFEMIVASSNNAAVENISRDLPKRESVYDPKIQYLQPVAHNIAANNGSKGCEKLSDNNMPWGLIAAAMGRKSNRHAFGQKFFFDKVKTTDPQTWSGEQRPLNFWEWRQETLPEVDKQENFRSACTAFKTAHRAVEDAISEMEAFASVSKRLSGHTRESWLEEANSHVTACATALEQAKDELTSKQSKLIHLSKNLGELENDRVLIEQTKPSWLQRMLGTESAKQYRSRISQNASDQLALRQKKRKFSSLTEQMLQPAAKKAEEALEEAQNRCEEASQEWDDLQRTYARYLTKFGNIAPPPDLAMIEGDDVQRFGFWHTSDLAKLRSELFKTALELHEAWLLAVSQKGGGFGANLFKLNDAILNKYPGCKEDVLALWQSLFMIVPVISSTFASFARQFADLGPDSLGWLFIDEAGQAVPQAAVGALMRAKRAIVIGDPLQIEPVFTLPKQLINELAHISPTTQNGSYSPDQVSAQVLADRANTYGAYVETGGNEPVWIGSPLRVHRRCIDPMFSIANSIAYENRMVLGNSTVTEGPNIAPFLGPSCWIDLPGPVQGKQAVPQQIDFVAQLIADYHTTLGSLPKIYVISPFKEVKEQLSNRLKNMLGQPAAFRTDKKALNTWIKERVGTVHTFQGKEEDTVIMVLGADFNAQGATQWAASKPNILNVALTRAKRRFYIVGDRKLWGGLSHFNEAKQSLPQVTPAEFAANAKSVWAEQTKPESSP